LKCIISVIIPVFNSANYLHKCLDSLIGQINDNVEVILVNDGSTDNSLSICEYYANKDNRFKIINKENEGPSLTRKLGLTIAKGNYIIFVDSDDYIEEDAISVITNILDKESDIDILQFAYKTVDENFNDLNKEKPISNNTIIGQYECSHYFAKQENTTNFLWDKVFNAKLFDDIYFPSFFVGEDSCILTQIFNKAYKYKIIDKKLYNYVMTNDSLSRSVFSEKSLDNIKAGLFMYNFYKEYDESLCVYSSYHICSYSARLYCQAKYNDKLSQELKNNLSQVFNEHYMKVKNNKLKVNISKKRWLFVELFSKSKLLAYYLYKIEKVKK